MNEAEVTKELKKIFKSIFSDNNFIFSRKLSANDIDQWDSLRHVNLIVAIEKKFKISFTLEELEKQESVGDTIDLILKKI
jgi:acyl carrier protein